MDKQGGYTPDQLQTAMNALGLLTATYHDEHDFGEITKNYLTSVVVEGDQAPDGRFRTVVTLATGMTALARVLVWRRYEETGATWEETLAELGRYTQEFFSPDG